MKHVVVLKGGLSAEREVSLVSGAACAKALRELGYRVTEIDAGADLSAQLAAAKPEVVFNALHGRYGEDGCVQGVLELLKIPYTHSGVLASALAMDKPMAKKLFASVGLRCPEGKVVSLADIQRGDPLPRPFVIKPVNEGSSVGVLMLRAGDNRTAEELFADRNSANHDPRCALFLAEPYIPGRELTVAVLRGNALGVTELRPISGFYDYENKYTGGKTEHLCPAPIPDNVRDAAMRMAETAHEVLGCSGLTRSDFRYDDTASARPDNLYLLEINTQPGMTPLSLSPELAAHAGIAFTTLVQMVLEDASLGH